MNAATVYSNASVVVRPLILERAIWPRGEKPGSFRTIKGTWYAHMDKSGPTSVVVPMISCPSCTGPLFLSHNAETARSLGRLVRQIVPIAHQIDTFGKVAPDMKCPHAGCSFHRTVYLDKWDRLRPLYSIAYLEGRDLEIQFAYSHAASQKEARIHLGAGNFTIVAVGRAIGFAFDEKTRKFDVVR